MLEAIRVFITCAESGSFSKAGDILGMSPSSVSRKIDKLENILDAKLFRRSTRQISLTEVGRSFLDKAGHVLSELEAALLSTKPKSSEVAGRLRVSVFESFGRLCICPALPDFLSANPKLTIELSLDNKIVDLYKDKIDIAIRIGNLKNSRLKARRLIKNQLVLCASPDYFMHHSMPNQPEDLSEHNCLVLTPNRRVVWWYFRRDGIVRKIQVSGNLTSLGGTPLLEAALRGVGIVMLPMWMVAPSIQTNRLLPVLTRWTPYLNKTDNADIYAVYVDDPTTKPAIRLFIDHILDAC